MSFMNRLERLIAGGPPKSKNDAKQRLKLVLLHDQVDLSPAQMEQMREEIVAVVQKYVDINSDAVEFRLSKEDGKISLVSSIGVKRVTDKKSSAA